jgi:hypothetical protein
MWGPVQEACLELGGHFWNKPSVGERFECVECHWLGASNLPAVNECDA